MASESRTAELQKLVNKAGSIRTAELLILNDNGVAPSKSAIGRALHGAGTEYSVQCMIDHLTKALN